MLEQEFIPVAIWTTLFLATIGIVVIFRKYIKELILLFISLAIVFSLTEYALKVFYPQFLEHDVLFSYDPHLGWKFIPHKRGAIVHEGEARHYVEINSLGFRDHEPRSDANSRKKIMVVGDSFVSNLAVKDAEVFTEIMEKRLSNTDVLNFGVNGYGQTQEYLLLLQQLDTIKPDLVVLVIYIANDFFDNVGSDWLYQRPISTYSPKTSTLTIVPPPASTAAEIATRSRLFFYRRFHTYHLLNRGTMRLWSLAKRLWSLVNEQANGLSSSRTADGVASSPKTAATSPASGASSAHISPGFDLYSPRSSEHTELMFLVMQELLMRTARLVTDKNIPMVFVLAPSYFQWREDAHGSSSSDSESAPMDIDVSLPNRRLSSFAADNKLFMIDLLPILQSAGRGGNELYNRREQHWNSAGNLIVADAIIAYLKDLSLVEYRPNKAPPFLPGLREASVAASLP